MCAHEYIQALLLSHVVIFHVSAMKIPAEAFLVISVTNQFRSDQSLGVQHFNKHNSRHFSWLLVVPSTQCEPFQWPISFLWPSFSDAGVWPLPTEAVP